MMVRANHFVPDCLVPTIVTTHIGLYPINKPTKHEIIVAKSIIIIIITITITIIPIMILIHNGNSTATTTTTTNNNNNNNNTNHTTNNNTRPPDQPMQIWGPRPLLARNQTNKATRHKRDIHIYICVYIYIYVYTYVCICIYM